MASTLPQVIFIGAPVAKFSREFEGQGFTVRNLKSLTDWEEEILKIAESEQIILQTRSEKIFDNILADGRFVNQPNLISPNLSYLKLGNKGLVRELLARKFPQYTVSYKVIKNSVLAIHGEVEKQVQRLFPQEDVERRYIAKPVNGSHSSFVSTINNAEELRDYLRFASNSITEDVIIEDFITGQQYSLDTYVSRSGEVIHTPICQQVISENVTLYSGYPSQLPAAVEIQLQQVFTEIYRAMGLQTLAVHAEFRYSPEMGLRIIELNPRTGGYRSDMLNLSYGIDHIKNYVNIFSGQEIIVSRKLQKYSMCPQFWSEDTGVLVEITGLENLSELSSYSNHYVLQKVGRVVGPAAAGYQRCLTVILTNDSEQVLLGDLEKLQALIKIKVV